MKINKQLLSLIFPCFIYDREIENFFRNSAEKYGEVT
jgi:hypothetical protein